MLDVPPRPPKRRTRASTTDQRARTAEELLELAIAEARELDELDGTDGELDELLDAEPSMSQVEERGDDPLEGDEELDAEPLPNAHHVLHYRGAAIEVPPRDTRSMEELMSSGGLPMHPEAVPTQGLRGKITECRSRWRWRRQLNTLSSQDVIGLIRELGQLYESGLLTEAEFAQKRQDLLDRL